MVGGFVQIFAYLSNKNKEENKENALRVLDILFDKTDHNSYFTKLNFRSKEKFNSVHNYTLHLVVLRWLRHYNNSSLHKKKKIQMGIGRRLHH
jgi:hypothetical protein